MLFSVVCETTVNVNAALRESISSSFRSGYGADVSEITKKKKNADGDDCRQSKLVATAKRVLLGKIEYEEEPNYGHAVLESLKAKYIVNLSSIIISSLEISSITISQNNISNANRTLAI